MSGQLVGEVIAAAPKLRAMGLSPHGFHALLAIAEKCRCDTRRATVRREHIKNAIYATKPGDNPVPPSDSTGERAVRELVDLKLVDVVKRGHKAHGQTEARATEYELMPMPGQLPSSKVTDAGGAAAVIQGDGSLGTSSRQNSDQLPSKPGAAPVIQGDGYDGNLTDNLTGDARASEQIEQLATHTGQQTTPAAKNLSVKDHPPPDGGVVSLDEKRAKDLAEVHKAFRDLTDRVPMDPPDRTCPTGPCVQDCKRCGIDRAARQHWHASMVDAGKQLFGLSNRAAKLDDGLFKAVKFERLQRLDVLDKLGLDRYEVRAK